MFKNTARELTICYFNLRRGIRKKRLRTWLKSREKYPLSTMPTFDNRLDRNESKSFLPTIISFGTSDNLYSGCLRNLQGSTERTKNTGSLDVIPMGDPNYARKLKPSYIKIKLLTLQRPVLWLDCDSLMKDSISLPEGDWDLGSLFLPGNSLVRSSVRAADCLAFQPTANAIKFLEVWEFLCLENRRPESDHPNLLLAFELMKGSICEIDIEPHVTQRFMRGKLGLSLCSI